MFKFPRDPNGAVIGNWIAVHVDATFSGELGPFRFLNGRSDPMSGVWAARLAASAGGFLDHFEPADLEEIPVEAVEIEEGESYGEKPEDLEEIGRDSLEDALERMNRHSLQAAAHGLEIPIDLRWGAARLRQEIRSALLGQ